MAHSIPYRTTLLLALALLATVPGRAVAQEATPVAATPAAAAAPLDLAAMVVRPSDVGRPGWVQASGQHRPSPSYGALLASPPLRYYLAEVALPSPDPSPDYFGQEVRTDLWAFADGAAAAAAFAPFFNRGFSADEAGVTETRPVGDRSALSRGTGNAPGPAGNRPYHGLALRFRVGPVLARVTIRTYPSAPPGVLPEDAPTIGALAATVEAHVEAGLVLGADPGLSPRVLRLVGPTATSVALSEFYERLRGDDLALYGEPGDDRVLRLADYAGATDVYRLDQAVAATAPVRIIAILYRLPDAATAAAWLAGLPGRLAALPAATGAFTPLGGAPLLGDGTLAFTHEGSAGARHGVRLYLRQGAVAAAVEAYGSRAPALGVVVALARAQLACLGADAGCPAVAAPAGLTGKPAGSATATPAA